MRQEAVLSSAETSYLAGWDPIGGLELGRQYQHAPIIEAVLEFRVATGEDLVLQKLGDLDLGDGYSDPPQTMYTTQAEFKLTPGQTVNLTEARQDSTGFRYRRADGDRMVQVSGQQFAFMWLGHYTNWEAFIGEAERAWLTYKAVAAPTVLESIGVRFVNVIKAPPKPIEIGDYLRITVSVPPALPQNVQGLFSQVDIPLPDDDASVTVTTAIVDPNEEVPYGGLLLDIDVKAPVALATQEGGFSGEIAAKLDRLRFAKNLVFEACITDATRGLIDG